MVKGFNEIEGEKKAFLKFEISDLMFTTIYNAKLRLYANSTDGVTTVTTFNTENSWTEDELTWNNVPVVGTEISTVSVGNANVFYEFADEPMN